jgi:hypothetical protein
LGSVSADDLDRDGVPELMVGAPGESVGDTPTRAAPTVFQQRTCPSRPALTAIVGWQSPIGGSAFIEARFADIDVSCGDGIGWAIDKDTLTIASGSFGNGGHQAFNGSVTLQEGDFLYFTVDAGGRSNHACDSTRLDLTIVKGTPSWATWY